MARDTSRYVIDGVRWPSVTEVLDIAGLSDWGRVPEAVLEVARDRGERVHEWLELLDQGYLGPKDNPDEEIAGYVNAYLLFKTETGFTPKLIEKVVVNRDYSYVGTLDRTGTLRERRQPALVDIKAVNQVSKVTALQTAGYAACLDEPHRRYALQLKPTGKYTLHPYADRNDKHDFLAACRLAHWRIRNGEIEL